MTYLIIKDFLETNQRGDRVWYHNINNTELLKKNNNLPETNQRGDEVWYHNFKDTEQINDF